MAAQVALPDLFVVLSVLGACLYLAIVFMQVFVIVRCSSVIGASPFNPAADERRFPLPSTRRLQELSLAASALSVQLGRSLCPPVSIIKPLKGAEPEMEANLTSFFFLAYNGPWELIFCVESTADSAVPIVHRLLSRYTHVDARLHIAGKPCGVNPKINNMADAYRTAKYDCVWICDSSIFTLPHTLLEMSAWLDDPKTAVVHQLPFVVAPVGVGGNVESVFFATQHSRVYLFANLLGLNCTNGMSILFRRSLVKSVGGLTAFANVLAEDFFMCDALHKKGLRFPVCREPALQNFGEKPLGVYFARHARWTRLRKFMLPLQTPLEPLSEGLLLGVVGTLSLGYILDAQRHSTLLAAYSVHVLAWLLTDLILMAVLERRSLQLPLLYRLSSARRLAVTLCAWFAREAVTYLVWGYAMAGKTIRWRDRVFRLSYTGRATQLQSDEKAKRE